VPTAEPTAAPTLYPTPEPTPEPTLYPTPEPSAMPTAYPTLEPTAYPTPTPTAYPTPEPTLEPSATPTATPTFRFTCNGEIDGTDGSPSSTSSTECLTCVAPGDRTQHDHCATCNDGHYINGALCTKSDTNSLVAAVRPACAGQPGSQEEAAYLKCGVCCSYKHQTEAEGTAPHAFFGDAENYAWVTGGGHYASNTVHPHTSDLQWSDGQENFTWDTWNPYEYTTITKNIGHATTRVHHARHNPEFFGDGGDSEVPASKVSHYCTSREAYQADDELRRCECFQADGSSCME